MPLSRRTRSLLPIALVLVVILLGLAVLIRATDVRLPVPGGGGERPADRQTTWPTAGQAAVSVTGHDDPASSGLQPPVPIASVTKIMTALVVLERAPLADGHDGDTLTITAADVVDTARRRAHSESVVAVRAGDRLTERQALLALLLPSANNVAHLLAERTAGTEAAFVQLMNARARSLGMSRTTYADASGVDPASRSTARDQTVLARVAMANPTFAWLVAQPDVTLPTAGTVTTTNQLLGVRGFVGVKTGSTTPAGGCFVFAAYREVDGRPRLVVGAVLGQRGNQPLRTAFGAAERLVDSVTDPSS
jgi:D-alanyl-D-alanine carboxypeptidase (penicillin-binding protein 5/6)